MGFRISVDVGGTFTDLTIAQEGVLLGRHKSPTTPDDLTRGVFNCVRLASQEMGLSMQELLGDTEAFMHGSTTATNAILEGKGAKTGVICTKGTKYTLWRGEGRRLDIFNFKREPRTPLIRPYLCLEVTERIDREGTVLLPLDEAEVRASVRQLKEWEVETIAVCLLWSIVNDAHERRVGEIIEEEWPGAIYSLSSDIQPIIREYHRMSCVSLNCMVQPVVSDYLDRLQQGLSDQGFKGDALIVDSSGGLAPAREIMHKPVFMLFSGPSMGPVAGRYFSRQQAEKNCIVIDMGGTSFDVSNVIDGRISTTRNGRILDYPTGVSATEVLTLGAGGGSIAWVDAGGILHVGPQSAGAVPGPACYMRGGEQPTVTDACVALGYIVPDHFLGGRMEIDPDLAHQVIEEHIARPLGLGVQEAAYGICQVIQEKMIGGILDMTVRRGIDPREFAIVSGGGATGLFAAFMAQELKVRKVIIPRQTAVLCAFGALNADIAMSSVASKYALSSKFDFQGVNATLEALQRKGEQFLDRLDSPPERRSFEYYTAARYPMQVTELDIPLSGYALEADDLARLLEDFHRAHEARYKTADEGSDVEFVMWGGMATSATPRISLEREPHGMEDPSAALIGEQPAFFNKAQGGVEIPYYDGERLRHGMSVPGPAIIVLTDTTILVPERVDLSVEEHGYFIMDLGV
jgi:N-methylhydantoinase A